MKNLILFSLLLMIANIAFAQRDDIHPIEKWRTDCYNTDSNMTTYGMCMCEKQAQEKWEVELNVVYKQLMKILDTDDKAYMIESQKAWLIYREKELKFIREHYYKIDGTMWKHISASYQTDLTRDRVLELKKYLYLGE